MYSTINIDLANQIADIEIVTDKYLQPEHRAIAERVIRRREGAGLTQAMLARDTGLPPSTISRIESGEEPPSRRALMLISAVVGMTMIEFFAPLDPPDSKQSGVSEHGQGGDITQDQG